MLTTQLHQTTVSVLFSSSLLIAGQSLAANPVTVDQQAPVSDSPNDAFDAYCRATKAKDWQGVLNAETPRRVDDEVYEAYTVCGMDPKCAEISGKFRIDSQQLYVEYKKKYSEKHGIDIDKAMAERKLNEAKLSQASPQQLVTDKKTGRTVAVPVYDYSKISPPIPEPDEALFRSVFLNQLDKNKRAYYCELHDLFGAFGDIPLDGKLQEIAIAGDRAGGLVKTVYVVKGESIDASGRRSQFVEPRATKVQIRFAKIGRSWLLD